MDGEEKELLLLHFQTLETQIRDMEKRLTKKIDSVLESVHKNTKDINAIREDYVSKRRVKWYIATATGIIAAVVGVAEKIKELMR